MKKKISKYYTPKPIVTRFATSAMAKKYGSQDRKRPGVKKVKIEGHKVTVYYKRRKR